MDQRARLRARPARIAASASPPTGLRSLALDAERDSYLYVPPGARPTAPAPLALLLHGAGGHAHHGMGLLLEAADQHGLILLAPASRADTWDVLVDGYGPDVERIDAALEHVFGRYAVDPERLAIGGFSDGASYALSLGITNGALFSHIIAFSPGFVAPAEQEDAPQIFISHGTDDRVLPIDACSRRIAPRLERAGYGLRYVEFDGGHTIPPEIAEEALRWFLGGRSASA